MLFLHITQHPPIQRLFFDDNQGLFISFMYAERDQGLLHYTNGD